MSRITFSRIDSPGTSCGSMVINSVMQEPSLKLRTESKPRSIIMLLSLLQPRRTGGISILNVPSICEENATLLTARDFPTKVQSLMDYYKQVRPSACLPQLSPEKALDFQIPPSPNPGLTPKHLGLRICTKEMRTLTPCGGVSTNDSVGVKNHGKCLAPGELSANIPLFWNVQLLFPTFQNFHRVPRLRSNVIFVMNYCIVASPSSSL